MVSSKTIRRSISYFVLFPITSMILTSVASADDSLKSKLEGELLERSKNLVNIVQEEKEDQRDIEIPETEDYLKESVAST